MRSRDIETLLTQRRRFLLLIHHSPDGDAIASSLALGLILRRLGKEADVVCADPIPVQFQFLPGVGLIKHDFFVGDYDVIVTLDCGDSRRTGFRQRLKSLLNHRGAKLVNIDHHPKNDLHALADYNYVDQLAPSTSFLVYELSRGLGVNLDHKIATCLLTGLYTDTGGFKHPNTTAEALKFASRLLTCGARLKDITTHISQPTSVQRLKLWGIALSRVRSHPAYNLVTSVVYARDIISSGATDADLAGIFALLTTIPARVVALVIYSSNGRTEVRMRTNDRTVNLARLAAYVGGGGQRQSAGFTVELNLELSGNYGDG